MNPYPLVYQGLGRRDRQHASKLVEHKPSGPSSESAETPPGPAALPPPPPANAPLSRRAKFTGWLKKLPFGWRANPPQPSPAPKARRGAQPSIVVSTDPVYQSAQSTGHADVERDPRGPSCQASVGTALVPSAPSLPVNTSRSTSSEPFFPGSCTDPPQPNTIPNAPRGVQPSVVASTHRAQPSDPRAKPVTAEPVITELAIATRVGLRNFIHVPRQSVTPIHNTKSIPPDDSDDSSDSSGSSTSYTSGRRLRYRYLGRDVRMVLDRLRQGGFRERQPNCPRSSLAQSCDLGCDVEAYLSRQPDAGSQIRILILSGHNAKAGFTINDKVVLGWNHLRRALGKVPPGIVTIVILACCRAGDILQDLVDIPNTVVIAGCADEPAVADNYDGDYFLSTLFEVLDARGGFDQWEDFRGLISRKLKKRTEGQDPRLVANTEQEPPDIFRALMKPSRTPTRGCRPAVAQVGD
ncbi:hypothetical protein FRC10_001556 [Ceratobasidium sp. 414]|nr:hypothetical protein FRC10_001556 [Ceratobasidium sp. 414]